MEILYHYSSQAFKIQGVRFQGWGLRFRVQDLHGFRVLGSRSIGFQALGLQDFGFQV